MKYVCKENMCAGCMACIEKCSMYAIRIEDGLDAYNAVIDESKCIRCEACHQVCPNNSLPQFYTPITWYQGWDELEDERASSSSGGFATALARQIIKNNGIVCSCVFHDGKFQFDFIDKVEELASIKGSKYVKSNPVKIYKRVKEYLISGKKVLFIGLPCQVAAVKNYVGNNFANLLYTVDLICHGTPSPQLLESFLQEKKININSLENISFRKKTLFKIFFNETPIVSEGMIDWYSFSFLQSVSYTNNCYFCQYAKKERVSDITIGDSWKSNVSEKEMSKGVSLALCQTEKGKQLLIESGVKLLPVDIENAVRANAQLNHPSIEPKERQIFFNEYKRNHKFHRAILQCYPKLYIKNIIKQLLLKLKLPI